MPNALKVKDLVNNVVLEPEVFDYVVVATGHYSTPHVPHFEVITVDGAYQIVNVTTILRGSTSFLDVSCTPTTSGGPRSLPASDCC